MTCPYVDGYYFESESGETVQMKSIWEIANKALAQIVSELPKEARTHDVVAKVLKETELQLKGINVSL